MKKVRSLDELQDALDKEFSWRIYEISALKKAIPERDTKGRKSIIRANIAILYAHWEGFIKASAGYYLEYVSRKGLRANELLDCFAYLGLKKQMNDLVVTKKADYGILVLRHIRAGFQEALPMSFEGVLRTESNLKSEIFSSIVTSLGLPVEKYTPYINLIDESLLEKRNSIAHGEHLEVDVAAFAETSEKTLMLLRWFKADIENAASTASYRAVA